MIALVEKAQNWLLSHAVGILVFGGIQYLVLSTVAMALYPGGTKYDPATTGYLFWNNMLSDMGRTVAHNGEPNTASCALFITTMCIIAACLVPFFASLSKEVPAGDARTRRLSLIAELLGIGTGVLLALAAAFPQDLHPQLHLRFAQFAFVVLAPSSLIYGWLFRGDAVFPRPCAQTFFTFSIVLLAGIIVTIASGSGSDVVTVTVQATTQKIMVYAWNACLYIEGWSVWRCQRRGDGYPATGGSSA